MLQITYTILPRIVQSFSPGACCSSGSHREHQTRRKVVQTVGQTRAAEGVRFASKWRQTGQVRLRRAKNTLRGEMGGEIYQDVYWTFLQF